MRRLFLAFLMVAPSAFAFAPAPLALSGDGPEAAVAGARVAWNATVRSESPWTSGRVVLEVSDGASVAPAEVTLGPGTPEAIVEIAFETLSTGPHEIVLVARAEDGGDARNSWSFEVQKARAEAELSAAEPTGWYVPVAASVRVLDAARAEVSVALEVAYEAPEGWNASWSEPWPAASPAPAAEVARDFFARFGAGTYALVAVVNGSATGESAPLVLALAEPGPSRDSTRVAWDGAGSATALRLASDSVNADGKLKAPGEELITRVVAENPDGLEGELRGTIVLASGSTRSAGSVPLPEGTQASVEHRFAGSPISAGEHKLRLSVDEASVERTFVIKDARPVLRSGAAEPPEPRAGDAVVVRLAIGDRNLDEGGASPGKLVAKLFRASTPVAWPIAHGGVAANGSLTFDVPDATDPSWRVADGFGVVDADLAVAVPAEATPATYRLALYDNATKLGEVAFDVRPPPRVFDVRVLAARPGGDLVVDAGVEGESVAAFAVEGVFSGEGTAPVVGGRARAVFTLPRGLAAGDPLRVTARAANVSASVDAAVENVAPEAALVVRLDDVAGPRRVLPGATLEVAASADDANGDAFEVEVALEDASGAVVARAEDGRIVVPAGLPRGMYAVVATATDAGGAAGASRWNVTVAQWVEAGFLDASVAARAGGGAVRGDARVANLGNVPIREVVVAVGDLRGSAEVPARNATVTLKLPDGRAWSGPVLAGEARLAVEWPPGEATLTVAWPRAPGLPRGAYEGDLTLVVRGGAA